MRLHDFTSGRVLAGITEHGMTVGDFSMEIERWKGSVGVRHVEEAEVAFVSINIGKDMCHLVGLARRGRIGLRPKLSRHPRGKA